MEIAFKWKNDNKRKLSVWCEFRLFYRQIKNKLKFF